MKKLAICTILSVSALISTNIAFAQDHEHAASHPLEFMFGEWVGEASGIAPDRTPFTVTQTERVGPMLNGEVVVIEGRGYSDQGETAFNAFAVVSKSGPDGAWEMRSYTGGRAGTFPFELTQSGYVWSIPAGPNAIMQYTATFDGNSWSQIGQYIVAGADPVQVFQMSLERVGDSDWPAANPVSPSAGE